MDIHQLRVLNDYLNQTIDALSRQQWNTFPTNTIGGLSHSPYTQYSPFGMSPMGFSPTFPQYNVQPSSIVDPFFAARGLSHSTIGNNNPWTTMNLQSEIVRQNQLTQAVAARQQVLEALCRAAGIPV